jgi:hypothetical protein
MRNITQEQLKSISNGPFYHLYEQMVNGDLIPPPHAYKLVKFFEDADKKFECMDRIRWAMNAMDDGGVSLAR